MLEWTKKRPTRPGYYWRKDLRDGWSEGLQIVGLRDYCGKLCFINWEPAWEDYLWAGPIPEPIQVIFEENVEDE